jgi:hypothetical protein
VNLHHLFQTLFPVPFAEPPMPIPRLLPALAAFALLSCSQDEAPPRPPAAPMALRPAERIRLRFHDATRDPLRAAAVYATFTGLDAAGRSCRMDRAGRFLPCSSADNVVVRDGRAWCAYAIPLRDVPFIDLARTQTVLGGRLYLSVGAPLWLRVDDATGGLVQPDPANPADPNRSIRFDWVELTLDGSGFHGNTTCVDQFGLPIALAVVDRADPGRPMGRVGIVESRAALFQAYRAEMPAPFAALAEAQDLRILAPAHGAFAARGAGRDYFRGYIDAMWAKYRPEPLVLDTAGERFTGRVDDRDRLVFTRDGGGATFLIQGKPTTQEAFLGNGVLAQGGPTERALGAQIAAMLNRHALDRPRTRNDPAGYYRRDPCNRYARFWHEHSLDGRAYGFSYDDVADQSSSLATPEPLEIRIDYRLD